MDREAFVQLMRHGMRPASLFIWALFAVVIAYFLWPYSGVVLGAFVPYWLVKAFKIFRRDTGLSISRFPPLSREDWRVAKSKLKKGK